MKTGSLALREELKELESLRWPHPQLFPTPPPKKDKGQDPRVFIFGVLLSSSWSLTSSSEPGLTCPTPQAFFLTLVFDWFLIIRRGDANSPDSELGVFLPPAPAPRSCEIAGPLLCNSLTSHQSIFFIWIFNSPHVSRFPTPKVAKPASPAPYFTVSNWLYCTRHYCSNVPLKLMCWTFNIQFNTLGRQGLSKRWWG